MSRLFRFLVLGLSLLFCYHANSQVTLKLTDQEVIEGESIDVFLTVADFGQITKIDLSLNWDTSYLTFNSIDPENIGALSINNFNRAEVDNGAIGMEWEAIGLPFVSIPDGDPLFKLSFTTKRAGNTKIDLSDLPIPVAIVRTTNTNNPFDLRDLTEDDDFSGGNITILSPSAGMVSPPPPLALAGDVTFSLTPDKNIACIDDRICYSVAVENFDSIISFNFPIDWDPTVLAYDQAENFNLEHLAPADINATPADGILAFTYTGDINSAEGLATGVSVSDGTSIVNLCFNVIGSNNNQPSIFVGPDSQQPLGSEIVNVDSESSIPLFELPLVETFDCDQTIILNTACNSEIPGERVCVDIQPVIFQNVGNMFFSLNWDPSLLNFVELNTATNSDFNSLSFNQAPGNLDVDWSVPSGTTEGVTLTQDMPIATLCFVINANAPENSLIDLNYSNEAFFDIDAAPIDGTVRLEGCAIEVMEPPLPEPILSAASDIQVVEGEDVCVDILVENFTGITAFEFPVFWDSNVLEFIEVMSDFPGINSTIINDGEILIDWGSATTSPESLPGKAVLLSICFKGIGFPSSGIVFVENQSSFSIENETLIPAIENGLVTILAGPDNPVTFSTAPMDNLARNTSVCVPVTVRDFKDIFIATILVKWDSTVLSLDSLSNIQFPDFNPVNLNTETPGQLSLIWFDDDDISFSLDDGDVIFDLCFTTIGDIGACTEIEFPDSVDALLEGNQQLAEIINDPNPVTGGRHIGINDEGSEVCLTTFGIESFNLTEPTCDTDGSIDATIAGVQDNYLFFWTLNDTPDMQQGSTSSSLNRLLSAQVDSVCLSVFSITLDQNETRCTAVSIDDTRVPTAIADINGRDTLDVGCVDPDLHEVQLLGDFEESPDAISGVVTPSWTAIGRGSIKPFSDTIGGFGATAVGIGTYVFTITNANQCSDSDTLVIVDSASPALNIEADNQELTCNVTQIALTGMSSVNGNEWEFNWTNSEGDTLTGADPLQLVVEEGGLYSFLINNASNGCTSSEAIFVNENTPIVNAEAGDNQTLRCGEFVILDGRMSDQGGNFKIEWETENDFFQPDINLSSVINVTKAGTYILRVTDNPTGCFDTDTVRVFADPELPVAKARPEAFIGCNQTRTVLRPIFDGLDGTSSGAKFLYSWTTIDGTPISEEDTAAVSTLGEYLFIVVNDENDACAADTARVQVVENTTRPVATFPNSETIGCSEDCIDLIPEIGDLGADFIRDDLTYTWTTDVGTFCGDANSLTAQTNQTGTYFFVVRNTANNCEDTARINVFPDPDNGIIAEAGPVRELTCTLDSVSIGSEASSLGAGITYEWRFEEEEEVISEELLFTVREAGRYRLTVINEAAECQGSGSVEVTENKAFPIADAGSNFPLADCEIEPFKLNALNSDSGADISYQWTTTDGEIVSDETTLTPTVSQIGTYTLEAINDISGCSSTSDVVVSSEVFAPAAIVEETERTLDCTDNTIVLDASSSFTDDGTNTATIEWTTVDGHIISGANTKNLVVDSAGTYLLTLTADNGCEDRATVVVTNTAILPEIDAGEGFRLTCNEQMTLDASNSSFNENLVIQWTTNDGSIVAGANTLMPEINLGGTYTLVIRDTTNNCRVEDVVIIESDEILPVAQAGENIEVCGREAALSANPTTDGITGIWRVLNGGQIDANDPLTNVTSLSAGENQFIWTLSSNDCPDFSSDTVIVNALTLPIAVEDDFEFIVGQGTVELDLVGNDQPNTENFAINIIRDPATSILNKESEGVYSLDLPSRPTRQDFQYEICSATCADVCADATVRLVVRPEAIDSLEFNPNAITPNGDGLNDVLIFDELFIEDFPQSELVIFNRWGDVVYKVSPYNNDWQGSDNDGVAITEGTYYYILRLDISEGDIIRGDVTVLR